MFPIVDGIEKEFAGEVTVVRLNAEGTEVIGLMSSYGVRGHPSFVILDASNAVTHRFTGPQSEESLRQAMTAVADDG